MYSKLKTHPVFPGYTWIGDIKPFGLERSTRLGIYKSISGELHFVKSYTGPRGRQKQSILNESKIYRILNSLPISRSDTVSIPKINKVIKTDSSVTLIIEYIKNSHILETTNISTFVNSYFQVIDYLDKVSKSLDKGAVDSIPRRNYLFYLVFLPVICMKAVYNYPKNTKLFLSSLLDFYKSITIGAFKTTSLTLCHRDLNNRNIICSINRLYPIDFQYAAFTIPEFEIASTIRSHCGDNGLVLGIVEEAYSRGYKAKLIKQMLIFYSLFGLSDPKFTPLRTKDFKDCLQFSKQL